MGRRSTLSADGEGFGSETYIEAASFQVYKYEIGECNVGRLFNKFQIDSASIVNNFDISATLTNVSKFLYVYMQAMYWILFNSVGGKRV